MIHLSLFAAVSWWVFRHGAHCSQHCGYNEGKGRKRCAGMCAAQTAGFKLQPILSWDYLGLYLARNLSTCLTSAQPMMLLESPINISAFPVILEELLYIFCILYVYTFFTYSLALKLQQGSKSYAKPRPLQLDIPHTNYCKFVSLVISFGASEHLVEFTVLF